MKRSLLALLLSILFFTPQLIAQGHHGHQDMEDVIYLKNGSVYRGEIIATDPGKSYKIDKVTREARKYYLESSEHGHHGKRYKGEHYAKIEATGSGLLYFRQPFGPPSQREITGGGGLSFMTEVGRRGGCFTLVTGVATQFLSLHNFNFTRSDFYYNFDYSQIGTGVQTRFQIPVWLRWTFGQQVPVFFQFGFSTGFNCYQGRGIETTGSNSGGSAPIQKYGWQKNYDGYFNLSSVGIGFKKMLSPTLDLIIYAEGSPGQLVVIGSNVYQPYVEIHAGINFDPKRYRQSKKSNFKTP
jgi:hypothetical protein